MKIKSKNSVELRPFVDSGIFFGIQVGKRLQDLGIDKVEELTIGTDHQKWYDVEYCNCRVRIEVIDEHINSIIVQMESWNQDVDFLYDGKSIKAMNLLEFLSMVDRDGLEWDFKSCTLKVLVGRFLQSNVEFIYDCNQYEDRENKGPDYFFYSFQAVAKEL